MIRLSAFADEISADLNEQIEVLHSEHIHFIDLRGVWNTNVLDLTDQQVTEIKQTLDCTTASEFRLLPLPLAKYLYMLLLRNTCSVSGERSSLLSSFKLLLYASSLSIHLFQMVMQTLGMRALILLPGEMRYSADCAN